MKQLSSKRPTLSFIVLAGTRSPFVNRIRTVGYDPMTKRRGDGEEAGSGLLGAGPIIISPHGQACRRESSAQ